MAVIKRSFKGKNRQILNNQRHSGNPCRYDGRKNKAGLSALTAAALTLPGLIDTPAFAADEETSFTYGHYQEGKRNLFGAQSAFSPIEVESLQGSTKFKLTDRVKFAFNYVQDTWGGATPIATAPLSIGGNGRFNGTKSILSGATPYLKGNNILFDKSLNPLINQGLDQAGNQVYTTNNRLVHTLSQASPETRKQGDFKLGYEWDEAALDVGGGISIEDDYESRFGNINTRWDFNQKQTTVNVGLSYTNSDTRATIDHDANTYIKKDDKFDPIKNFPELDGKTLITGKRQDWSVSLGLTQILNKNALVEAGLGYTRSTGYMENPYKAVTVAFVDPNQDPFNNKCGTGNPDILCGDVAALLEQRPDIRNQWNGNLRLVQHIGAVDAAVHLGYRVFSDDWGITSHTFDADWAQPLGNGWKVTPRVRYYSQDAADFYTPFLVSKQGYESNVVDPVKGNVFVDLNNPNSPDFFIDSTGTIIPDFDVIGSDPVTGNAVLDVNGKPLTQAQVDNIALANKTAEFDRSKLPANFSSDQRLSGYGTLSGGVTVSKQFAKGVGLDLGFEYYTHQGGLKIGGGGEGNYADFDYWTANATLKVDLAALSLGDSGSGDHSNHAHHNHGVHAPAGVMFDHMLSKAGDMMVGYRYMYGNQSGDMLRGNQQVNNQAIVDGGCGPNPCFLSPNNMTMHMHMLDLMYAPTDWLTLMLMPQFVDMNMGMERLDGAPVDQESNNNVGNPLGQNGQPTNIAAHIPHHVQNGHETGGIGDLGMYALFKLLDTGIHHIHATAGLSAPTGDVDIQLRKNHTIDGGFIHYGMQLGSTWDFKPSLTYTGHIDQFSWGAQANGTVRMESQNKSGYRLGDLF